MRTSILQYTCTKMAGPYIGSAILKEEKREKQKISVKKKLDISFLVPISVMCHYRYLFSLKTRRCVTECVSRSEFVSNVAPMTSVIRKSPQLKVNMQNANIDLK